MSNDEDTVPLTLEEKSEYQNEMLQTRLETEKSEEKSKAAWADFLYILWREKSKNNRSLS